MLYRRGVIAAVRTFGERYFACADHRARLAILKELAAETCRIHGLPAPVVDMHTDSDGRLGHCTSEGIYFNGKITFTTFLHELYHWLTLGTSVSRDEAIARQWSVVLLCRSMPARASRFCIQIGNVVLPPTRRQAPGRRLRRVLSPATPAPAAEPVPVEPVAVQ